MSEYYERSSIEETLDEEAWIASHEEHEEPEGHSAYGIRRWGTFFVVHLSELDAEVEAAAKAAARV